MSPALSRRLFAELPPSGIAPASVPAFVAAQLAGGVAAFGLVRALYPDLTHAAQVIAA